MKMEFSTYLTAEWRASLGCTEPAAIAYAAAMAASYQRGQLQTVRLVCDARTYKNCYSVGIPNAESRTGILWTLAIGGNLADHSLGLRCFEMISAGVLQAAGNLMARGGIQVEVDPARTTLFIDVTVVCEGGIGRAVVEREHTNLTRLESNDKQVPIQPPERMTSNTGSIRALIAGLTIQETMELARSLTAEDRMALREGVSCNTDVARDAMSLVPEIFVHTQMRDGQGRAELYVNAGVTARMTGVSRMVMTLAGSGNKGITVSIPVWLWGRESGYPEDRIDEALAFTFLITSATTHHLGTLSAACGSAIAAGAGIAAGLVMLNGGGAHEAGLAVSNVVGTLAGMICDGAKVGCAMKTATGVEAAFRATKYAMSGQGIPVTNGIVGRDGETSLIYLGLVVSRGMANMDAEILDIMQKKLRET